MKSIVDAPSTPAPTPVGPARARPTLARPTLVGPAWLGPPISARSAWSVLAAWGVTTLVLPVLEPAPAHPETGVWATLLGVAMGVGLLATMAGVALRRRAGLWVSAATALASLGAAVMCPVSGHHRFGAWWVGELALLGGVAFATERALRRG